jgi:hypothetical protein
VRRVLALAALSLVVAAPAHAGNGARDLGYLNAERASVGLPAGIAENTDWSQKCAKHNAYEQQNGVLTHEEDPAKPGYTDDGHWAGENSILASGGAWTPGPTPWDNAPIHLVQLYTPSLAQIGIDEAGGYICATTWPGMTRAPVASERVTTYPGDGVKGIPPSENAAESPFVPGDFVGVPSGTTAGRELFVYIDEPGVPGPGDVKITAASLSGPAGPVQVRWVDRHTDQIGPYLSGGVIIPVKPLSPGTLYHATVTVNGAHGSIMHVWQFTTAGSAGKLASVKRVRARRGGREVAFDLVCGHALPCKGRGLLGHGRTLIGKRKFSVALGATKTVHVKLNKRGRKLRARPGKLQASLKVAVMGADGKAHTVKTRKLSLG